jgi:predicted acylesterase/phospholipase RssA
MNIKHLVLSGGGPTLLQSLGSIQYLIKEKKINIENIETIYGTSAGAILGAFLCLKFDNETIYDYMIKRPWHNIFPITVQDILDAYTKKGIFDSKTVEKCFKPLFDAKDLSLDITLEDFYNYSKIELHVFTFEINNFVMEDISYKTHPKLALLEAIHMSCSIPVLVTPVCLESEKKCYTDGGIVCNYPLKYCVENATNQDEILGLKNIFNNCDTNKIHSDSTLLDFLMSILFKSIYNLSVDNTQPSIKYEITFDVISMNIENFQNALNSSEKRIELYESGVDISKQFLSTWENNV